MTDTGEVAEHEETNVRLPACAFAALAVVAGRWGVSRDTAVRRLLAAHVDHQEQSEPENRLTHISTVLRYPRPPRWRTEPRTDRPLRLRLPPGLAGRGRAVSLLLPGQSPRAHRDYQGRPLTDAVMTAIAREEPFTDEFLTGLYPLLRHRSALGLWQLAVAATSTGPENAVHAEAETSREIQQGAPSPAQRRKLLVAEALEEEISWHAPQRFQVATTIARDLLTGAEAAAYELMLYEQDRSWSEWLVNLRDGGADRDHAWRDTPRIHDWTGRGGTAVWRAERRVERQNLQDWLAKGPHADPIERAVRPPGWRLTLPGGWCARAVARSAAPMPDPYASWVAEGKTLTFPHQERQMVWPLVRDPDRRQWRPVPGIEPIVGAGRRVKPDQVVDYIEAVLIDWSAEHDDSVCMGLNLPVDMAYECGLITALQHRNLMAEARAANLEAMNDIITDLPADEYNLRYQLEQVNGDAVRFGQIARRAGIFHFRVIRPLLPWRGGSVVDELLTGSRTDFVARLAAQAYKSSSLIREQAMQVSGHEAFARYRPRGRM